MRGEASLDRGGVQSHATVRIDKGDADLTAVTAPPHPRGEAGSKLDDVVRAAFARRLGKHLPVGTALMLVQGHADPRLAALSGQPRRDHRGVVHHHQVASTQKRRQVADPPVMDGVAIQIQKPRGIPRAGGFHRNRLWRQFIVKI